MSRLRTRMMQGYFQFWDPSQKRWVFVHRRVAEKRHGGPLPAGSVVHHVNGNKRDNRPQNLRVLPHAAHRAQHMGTRRGE